MPDIEKYSGIEMADIEKISGHDVPSGGGITANSVSNSGVQMYGQSAVWANTDVEADFNIGPAISHTFTQIGVSRSYVQFHALKSDGTLWYWSNNTSYMNQSYFTSDSTWRQYGTDTDWTDLSVGQNAAMAVKGGNLMFLGYGSYRQRGDGSTSGESNWTTVNTAGNWSKVKLGYRCTCAINTSGEAYFTGYGYDYQTGQGSTSTINTFTREKNSLTNIVEANYGYRCMRLRNSSGDVYFTGNNAQGHAGPQITSSADVNGPTLAVSSSTNYVCAKLGSTTYHSGCMIDSDGYLRFHGGGSGRVRPDNSGQNATFANAGVRLTSLGTGWTYYDAGDYNGSTSQTMGIAIQSGAMLFGGDDAQTMKRTFGQTENSDWYQVRTGVTVAAQRASVLVAG